MLESLFDEIPNLGDSRRSALLNKFGSIAALRKATSEEIASVPGIGEKIASQILETLAELSAPEPAIDMTTGEIL